MYSYPGSAKYCLFFVAVTGRIYKCRGSFCGTLTWEVTPDPIWFGRWILWGPVFGYFICNLVWDIHIYIWDAFRPTAKYYNPMLSKKRQSRHKHIWSSILIIFLDHSPPLIDSLIQVKSYKPTGWRLYIVFSRAFQWWYIPKFENIRRTFAATAAGTSTLLLCGR